MEGNDISDEAADDIAICLSQNNKLKNLNLSCNKLQKEGMIKIVNALQNISSLVEFRDPPIMLIILPIMLCCTAQKFTYYA